MDQYLLKKIFIDAILATLGVKMRVWLSEWESDCLLEARSLAIRPGTQERAPDTQLWVWSSVKASQPWGCQRSPQWGDGVHRGTRRMGRKRRRRANFIYSYSGCTCFLFLPVVKRIDAKITVNFSWSSKPWNLLQVRPGITLMYLYHQQYCFSGSKS